MNRTYVDIGTYTAACVALIDQLSKWWLLTFVMTPPHRVEVFSNLNLVLNWNRGVTFGMLNRLHAWQPHILAAVAVVICVLLMRWLFEATTMWMGLGLGLIMGGALGNVADRLQHGAVVDFLDFHAFGYHWYTFNLADSAIVVGVFLLLLENLVLSRRRA